MKSPGYNKTHLPLDLAEDRQIIHRDYLAHCLRWSHVIKHCEIGERVLDLGSADGPMAMALYTNRYKPELYLGCDIRKAMVEKGREKMKQAPWAQFLEVDLCKDFNKVIATLGIARPSIITSFEFVEHIPEAEVEPFLVNVKGLMSSDTRFFLSTPCFDGKNKAANHIKEWTYEELKTLLEKHFIIEDHFGTFMSQKDLKRAFDEQKRFGATIMSPILGNGESLFESLRNYYDSNLLSILFAPLFPSYARNCLWRLKI